MEPQDVVAESPGVVDLTTMRGTLGQRLPAAQRYWRTRSARRIKSSKDGNLHGRPEVSSGDTSDFVYISGMKYFFQRFIRQYPVAAFIVWLILFLVELSMIVVYIVQSQITGDENISWTKYDPSYHSSWFYVRAILSFVSLLQLSFAYSLSLLTITVVLLTSIYQSVLFFLSFAPNMAWVSAMYVPLFLRCWPLRQYFLFMLDSVAIMTTRNRRLDLFRLAAAPLTLFICMVFSAAGVFRINQSFEGYPINVPNSIYFIIVTISTVGFGDIVPKTPDGKAITIVIIFIFVAQMPTFIQIIRSTAKIMKAYRSYKGRKNHFIVYGRVTREEVISIMDEVFCLYPMKSVCFCNNEFDAEVKSIGRHPTYRMRSTFLIVDTIDDFSLKRMKASDAAGVILLPVQEGHSSRVDDDVMLSSLIFERHFPDMPQYVWLRYGLHANLLQRKCSPILDERMKKNIMATALLLPGIVPFLVNLVRTAWTEGEEPSNLWTQTCIEDWKHQYEFSRRNAISICHVPECFVDKKLREVVSRFKRKDVLVVGVEETARKTMHLDLEYCLESDDVLVVVFERKRNSLALALEAFDQGEAEVAQQEHYGERFRHGINDNELFQRNMNESFVFYPYSSTMDVAAQDERRLGQTENDDLGDVGGVSEEEVKRALAEFDFVVKNPRAVQLQSLHFGVRATELLSYLIKRHEMAANDPYYAGNERQELLKSVEDQINRALLEAADNFLNAVTEREQHLLDDHLPKESEVFLFVDQTTSILRKSNLSVYEDIISQTIAQYELYSMMQAICSIHAQSRLTLLTLRKYPQEFLNAWSETFGTPLLYIRGQGSLESHLNYALNAETAVSRVRGILLYCSQMGPRDFGDVPIFSVETTVRELLEWNEREREGLRDLPEQNIVVELHSFTSCIKVSPFHSDPVWRRRGEKNFQDSLAFMMGRCFSSNMLQTLLVHSHRDSRIPKFFAMVLCLSTATEIFEMTQWSTTTGGDRQAQTLFKLCGNHSLQFQTFGDAFEFMLEKRSCIAVGVFRLFPATEMVNGYPRYFITNPPLQMPLLVEDIIYCLDGSSTDV